MSTGLEWDFVIVVGVEDGIIPHHRLDLTEEVQANEMKRKAVTALHEAEEARLLCVTLFSAPW